MKKGLKRLFSTLVFIFLSLEGYARSGKHHSLAYKFISTLAVIVLFVGLALFFFSETNRKKGRYSSGLESYKAGQSRSDFFGIVMVIILFLLFSLAKSCD